MSPNPVQPPSAGMGSAEVGTPFGPLPQCYRAINSRDLVLMRHLAVQLFERTTRTTRLTWAGQVFRDAAKHVRSALEQAKDCAKVAATGY
jgi:hypothetical protein